MSVLQHYYDLNFKDQFEALFGETYIGQQPTKEHHTYLVMMFNFSLVNPDLHFVHESFEDYGRTVVESFVRRYERFFDEDEQNVL